YEGVLADRCGPVDPVRLGRINVGGRVLPPDLPQPVNIRVMQPEDRIQPGRVRIGHQSGLLRGQLAAYQAMHPIMRLRLYCAVSPAAMFESGADAAEARAAAARHALEVRLSERVHVDIAQRHENVAITVRTVA